MLLTPKPISPTKQSTRRVIAKENIANNNQKVPLEVEQIKDLLSQEHSTTETSEDNLEVLLEDVSIGRERFRKG